MLRIDYDIADALITDPGLSILDPPSSFIKVIQSLGDTCPYIVPPSNNALMLRPVQLLPSWPSQTKFRSGDYGSPTGWEEQRVRADGDWWMHSLSSVTPLALSYCFPANTAWFIEFRAYALPKTQTQPIFDFQFGGHFSLLLESDGTAAVYDRRNSNGQPVGSGNIANGKSFLNQDVALLILPFRRGQLLIWSPNLGGYVDIKVAVDASGNITQSCSPVAYSSTQPPSALISITPLLYPADGIPAIEPPAKRLMRPLTQTPTVLNSVFDQLAQSQCTINPVTIYSSGTAPITEFIYSVTMLGNTSHQSAEDQGVLGISSATASSSGDSVFASSTYPFSLMTPFLYTTVIGYSRSLGTKEYMSNTLTGILDAKLRLSKDRSSKSFTFTIDNPANITGIGANYTSLKDLQNRRCRAYLTNAALESGSSHTVIAADPDPDTPLIVAYGYQRVSLFDGFSDQPEFVDGVQSRLSIRCQGLRKRLRNYLFPDQPIYDGMPHTSVMTDILMRCGFVGPTDTEPTGLGLEIICAISTDTLPSATPGDEPLFSPAIGSTAEEFVDLLQNYTGWILDDLLPVGSVNGCWYWVPSNYFAQSVYEAQGSPTVGESSVFTKGLGASTGVSLPDATVSNAGLGSLVMLSKPAPKQTLEELVANNIFVIGAEDAGSLIMASARDEASISDRTALNYVGEVRTYIFISQTINTQALANQVCSILCTNLTQARTHLSFTLPDYYPQLGIGAPLTLSGYWDGSIDSVEADLGQLNVRKTSITVTRGN